MQSEKCGLALQDDRHCVQRASQHKPGGLNSSVFLFSFCFLIKDTMKLLMTLLHILFVVHHPDFQARVDQGRPIRLHHRLLQPGVYAEVKDEHPAVRFSSGNVL